MAVTPAEVEAAVTAFPGVEESSSYGRRAWKVGKRNVAWERAFSKADVKRYGSEPVPEGPIVALTVADLAEKEAVLGANHRGVFTIPHFDGFAGVLVQLDRVAPGVFAELLEDAWLAAAPPAAAEAWLADRG